MRLLRRTGERTESEVVEFTPEALTSITGELKDALLSKAEPTDKEQKKAHRERKKQIRMLEKHYDKLNEYDSCPKQIDECHSMSETDADVTFMRMKEEARNKGQTKPGYNLQISAEIRFITDFALFFNSTYTLTPIPFFNSFLKRYAHLLSVAIADSGYGSEENYRFTDEAGMEAHVRYNRFHPKQRPRYKPNPFHHDNFHYNSDEDYYAYPTGQYMIRIGTSHSKIAGGYQSENVRYCDQNCRDCPLRCLCDKAKGNRHTI
ncbi:MAG: transposase [Muribaculaceae bacterium]|nr:transposase [Muribaculaceae bacterium]